ncbi:flagellar biosynthesis protein FlhB [Aminipila butyrica]|uniref:Flagellar biosynthetic protein FlhB n=1 Tax=Aminipila butyrica TaxID=433296 RepID=A0A858BWC9_9FIRM|nr:flagellar biosynthesis protein FlhB [Aminipila butyrica]QIB68386.1 flagellar biosynthesis protein FlhB [Aminipila butyrica]
MSQSKTEKATSKKRKDERKKGNVPQSKDVTSVISLLVIFSVLKKLFPYMYETFGSFFSFIMGKMVSVDVFSDAARTEVTVEAVKAMVISTLPLLLISAGIAILSTGAQTKFLFSSEAMKPKLSKFNPINGISRMFSVRSGVELIKNLIKITIIVVILYKFIYARFTEMARMLFLDPMQSSVYVLGAVVKMAYMVCIIFVFVAGLDYLYQRWEYERKIKMSKQEIKEEFKQTEGDPQIKGKIKQKQREMATSRMMQAVPTADVVIRNPTHFAVALKYDSETDQAPVVVAKGQDELALRIVAIAEQNGVYILEDRPLARAIYATAELKMEIPYAYYSAIAEVFALVYSIKKNDKDIKRN